MQVLMPFFAFCWVTWGLAVLHFFVGAVQWLVGNPSLWVAALAFIVGAYAATRPFGLFLLCAVVFRYLTISEDWPLFWALFFVSPSAAYTVMALHGMGGKGLIDGFLRREKE